jgi:hypothetical protein
MMTALFRRLESRLRRPAVALPLSAALLAVCAFVVYAHASSIAAVKEQLLPATLAIPGFERRISILKQQLEVSQLQASLRLQSPEEKLHAYVLPEDANVARLMSAFDVLRDHLQSTGDLASMEPIVVGTLPTDGAEGPKQVPLTVRVRVTEGGLHAMLAFVELSGMLTVADAFGQDELEQLLRLSEEENPAIIAHLEQFFAADLMRYAEEPKPFEEQLLRSFSDGPLQDSFRDILHGGRLASARDMLSGPLGRELDERRLWPMRFLSVRTWAIVAAEDGMLNATFELAAHSR